MYILRLDDAAENMNLTKWNRLEKLLDKYNIKPFVGVIPNNMDIELKKEQKVENFWSLIKKWQNKGWIICMHGYTHEYISNDSGINPVNDKSEFAGISYEEQVRKLKQAKCIFDKNGIETKVFFAPAHTFDSNTIKALKEVTNIRIISDMVAKDVYYKDEIWYIPVQSGRVRNLPFKVATFCYHPNEMAEEDFIKLEKFIKKNLNKFKTLNISNLKKRKKNVIDIILEKSYFIFRKVRKLLVKN